MIAATPGRCFLLAVAALWLWGACMTPTVVGDIAAFRRLALRPTASFPAASPTASPPSASPIVPIDLPGEPQTPPAYSTDSIVPLVYHVGPDQPGVLIAPSDPPGDPFAIAPAAGGGSVVLLSWPPPDEAAAPLTQPNAAARSNTRSKPRNPTAASAAEPATSPAAAAYDALAAGRADHAIPLFREALAATPSGPLAADLAYASLRLGRKRDAAAAFRTAVALGAPTREAERRWRQDAARLNRRFSASAWSFFREDRGGAPAAPVGVGALGQSQSALMLEYRPDPLASRPLLLQARLLAAHDSPDNARNSGGAPLRRTAQATAGVGWVALPAINGTVVAERWVGLGQEARDAFALRLHGGTGEGYGPANPGAVAWPHWSLFGEAAVVGLRRRDLYVGGTARAGCGLALGGETRATLTAALWAMAQHDDRTRHRVEAGPSLGVETRLGSVPVHLRLDYRLPLAAAPDSGHSLALTFAAGL